MLSTSIPEPEPEPEPEAEPEPATDEAEVIADPNGSSAAGDEAGARLVALKMALDGSSRSEIEQHLADNYDLNDSSDMVDDVFERAGR